MEGTGEKEELKRLVSAPGKKAEGDRPWPPFPSVGDCTCFVRET